MIHGLTKKFETIQFKDTKTVLKIRKFLEKPITNILIWGPHGNGKTFAVQDFLRQYHYMNQVEHRCLYITLSNMLMNLYERDWAQKISYLRNLINDWNVIALDEVDKIKLTEWKEEILFNFFDSRMSKMKRNLITSNKSPNKLAEHLGENIMSRILSECVVIEVKGEVMR